MPLPRGRPRSTTIDDAVQLAVVQLLGEQGYGALSIERVASVAGVAKTAIYRRWASKAEMVFAMTIHPEEIHPPTEIEPDQTLAEDLHALAERVISLLSTPVARQALPGLIADLSRDPSLMKRFHASLIQPERHLVLALLDRAYQRGELAQIPDAHDVHAQLLGTIYAWTFLVADDPPADLADRVTTSILATFRN
jgi:AcrR family transcriptional regulator